MNQMTQSSTDNVPRFPAAAGGHTESWFLRANHPTEPKALWLKATVLVRGDGQADAVAWCSLFDGDRTVALKQSQGLGLASFGDGSAIEVVGCSFELGSHGGKLDGKLESPAGDVRWDLRFERHAELGAPWCLLPTRSLVDARFPKNKLLTPVAAARFDGEVVWDGERWPVNGWWGMQGHNWGAAHAPEYAWGHCVFLDASGEPYCVAEGASGRIRLGRRESPILSLLSVRTREGREYRFDRLVDLWRQHGEIKFPRWTLRMRGRDGEALIAMQAQPERMVCLGYENPDRTLSHCLNSKTAAVTLRVNPVNAESFDAVSTCGGALEFLQSHPEPRVGPPC